MDGHQSGHSPVHCWGLVTCMLVRGEGTAHLAVWTPGLEHIPVCDMDVQNQKLHLAKMPRASEAQQSLRSMI